MSTSSNGSTSKRMRAVTSAGEQAYTGKIGCTAMTPLITKTFPHSSLFANRSVTCDALQFYSLSVLHPHSHPTSVQKILHGILGPLIQEKKVTPGERAARGRDGRGDPDQLGNERGSDERSWAGRGTAPSRRDGGWRG